MELKSKQKMSKISIKLKNINENFQCGICQGYIIDATTITECIHSFCKSCIVHFFETTDHKCPTCNSSIKDVKSCLRSDSSLQRLIYQLIPNLLENELDRREKFVINDKLKSEIILNNKTMLNLKLFFAPKNSEIIKEKYLQCVAQTPISILIKLLRNKFNIPITFAIKLSYLGHNINENETLLQLFTSFILDQNDVFDIKCELVRINKVKIECQTQFNENMQSISKLKIQTNEIEQREEKSNKQLLNKNFLKLKFRNKSNQSQSIQIRKSTTNKKLIRTIKNKESSSSPDDNSNEKEEKASTSTKEKDNSTTRKESESKTLTEENQETDGKLVEDDYANDDTLNNNKSNNEILENSVQLPLDLSVQKI